MIYWLVRVYIKSSLITREKQLEKLSTILKTKLSAHKIDVATQLRITFLADFRKSPFKAEQRNLQKPLLLPLTIPNKVRCWHVFWLLFYQYDHTHTRQIMNEVLMQPELFMILRSVQKLPLQHQQYPHMAFIVIRRICKLAFYFLLLMISLLRKSSHKVPAYKQGTYATFSTFLSTHFRLKAWFFGGASPFNS